MQIFFQYVCVALHNYLMQINYYVQLLSSGFVECNDKNGVIKPDKCWSSVLNKNANKSFVSIVILIGGSVREVVLEMQKVIMEYVN